MGCSVHWRPLHLHPYYREAFGWAEEHLPAASREWHRRDQFFARVPRPTPREREKMAEGLRAVIGKWPGDETEEQIREALKELS